MFTSVKQTTVIFLCNSLCLQCNRITSKNFSFFNLFYNIIIFSINKIITNRNIQFL